MMKTQNTVILLLIAALTPVACAQSYDEIIDITGTVRGIKVLSASVNGAPVTSATEDLWTENGLVSGSGGAGTVFAVGSLELTATPPSDNRVMLEWAGSGNAPPWNAEVRGGYGYRVSGPTGGGNAPDITVNMSTVTELDTTFVVRDFIFADLTLYEEMHLSGFSGGFIFEPETLELSWDFGRESLAMTGPRGAVFEGDVSGVMLVPGAYRVDQIAGEFLSVSGTGGAGFDWAVSNATVIARVGVRSRMNPPDEYDLNNDNDFDLDDLRDWRENSASGLPVYDTLGDGVIDDDDREELVRALSFLLDSPLIDCDGNLKHDPFEIEFDGVTPCSASTCSADFDGNGSVNLGDFGVFGAAFGSSVGDMNYNADADFDGNGSVNLGDFGVFGSQFGSGPETCTP